MCPLTSSHFNKGTNRDSGQFYARCSWIEITGWASHNAISVSPLRSEASSQIHVWAEISVYCYPAWWLARHLPYLYAITHPSPLQENHFVSPTPLSQQIKASTESLERPWMYEQFVANSVDTTQNVSKVRKLQVQPILSKQRRPHRYYRRAPRTFTALLKMPKQNNGPSDLNATANVLTTCHLCWEALISFFENHRCPSSCKLAIWTKASTISHLLRDEDRPDIFIEPGMKDDPPSKTIYGMMITYQWQQQNVHKALAIFMYSSALWLPITKRPEKKPHKADQPHSGEH